MRRPGARLDGQGLRRIALGFAVLCLSVSAAAARQSGFKDDLAEIPGVRIVYYDVAGSTPGQIQTSMRAEGLYDGFDNSPGDARTKWRIDWRWHIRPGGTCDLSTARVRFSATVTLPRLMGPVSPGAARRWHRFLVALRVHEAGHADFAYARSKDILAVIRSGTCANANAAAQAILDTIRQHDRDYDARTQHGRTQGAVFP